MEKISLNKKEAIELIMDESTIVIDVREEEELDEVPPIIDEIYNIPFNGDFLENIKHLESEGEIKKDSTILIYCGHGVKSLKAALALRGEGFSKAFDLKGGIAGIFSEIDEEYGDLVEDGE